MIYLERYTSLWTYKTTTAADSAVFQMCKYLYYQFSETSPEPATFPEYLLHTGLHFSDFLATDNPLPIPGFDRIPPSLIILLIDLFFLLN